MTGEPGSVLETGRSRSGAERITSAVERANADGRPAIAAFLTGGFPTRGAFPDLLASAVCEADLVEVGVPFSDPMADGLTIQRSSRTALQDGTTLPWILETIGRVAGAGPGEGKAPVLLMSYLNPIMAHGFERFAADSAKNGVTGLIVPDLPLEEAGELRTVLDARGMALVQLVTPATPPARLERVCTASRGFVYAVTMKGTTGASVDVGSAGPYLRRVRSVSRLPVLAGFGVRSAADVARLGRLADGVIVGSALVEAIEQGKDPAAFVRGLRAGEEAS